MQQMQQQDEEEDEEQQEEYDQQDDEGDDEMQDEDDDENEIIPNSHPPQVPEDGNYIDALNEAGVDQARIDQL
jgi:hypothetical protein